MAELFLTIVLVLVFSAFVFVLYLYLKHRDTHSQVSDQTGPLSSFGVKVGSPNTSAILNSCGPSNNQKCLFNQVGGLPNAIAQCDALSKICDMFTYDNVNDIMYITPSTATVSQTSNSNINTYIRQVKVTYQN